MVCGAPRSRSSGGRSAVSTTSGTRASDASTTAGAKLRPPCRMSPGRRPAGASPSPARARRTRPPVHRGAPGREPGWRASASASGIDRDPGHTMASRTPPPTSSSTIARRRGATSVMARRLQPPERRRASLAASSPTPPTPGRVPSRPRCRSPRTGSPAHPRPRRPEGDHELAIAVGPEPADRARHTSRDRSPRAPRGAPGRRHAASRPPPASGGAGRPGPAGPASSRSMPVIGVTRCCSVGSGTICGARDVQRLDERCEALAQHVDHDGVLLAVLLGGQQSCRQPLVRRRVGATWCGPARRPSRRTGPAVDHRSGEAPRKVGPPRVNAKACSREPWRARPQGARRRRGPPSARCPRRRASTTLSIRPRPTAPASSATSPLPFGGPGARRRGAGAQPSCRRRRARRRADEHRSRPRPLRRRSSAGSSARTSSIEPRRSSVASRCPCLVAPNIGSTSDAGSEGRPRVVGRRLAPAEAEATEQDRAAAPQPRPARSRSDRRQPEPRQARPRHAEPSGPPTSTAHARPSRRSNARRRLEPERSLEALARAAANQVDRIERGRWPASPPRPAPRAGGAAARSVALSALSRPDVRRRRADGRGWSWRHGAGWSRCAPRGRPRSAAASLAAPGSCLPAVPVVRQQPARHDLVDRPEPDDAGQRGVDRRDHALGDGPVEVARDDRRRTDRGARSSRPGTCDPHRCRRRTAAAPSCDARRICQDRPDRRSRGRSARSPAATARSTLATSRSAVVRISSRKIDSLVGKWK